MKTERGAASIRLELFGSKINVYRTDKSAIRLIGIRKVKAGTWNAIFKLLEECGEVTHRVK